MPEARLSHQTPQPPVFITGVPRCGSSWVGSVLGSASNVRYIYEPLNAQWVPALQGKLSHFRYLPAGHHAWPALSEAADRAFDGKQSLKQLARAARRGYLGSSVRRANRVLVKDPTAVLMADWLGQRFGANVLVIVRHPCGFASSINALGWKFRVDRLLQQEPLMNDYLSEYELVLRSAAEDPWHNKGAFWAAIHTVLARQATMRPEWSFRHYEELCAQPQAEYEHIAADLGLANSPSSLKRMLGRNTLTSKDPGSTRKDSSLMAEIWRERMSPGEIDAVIGVVNEFDTGGLYRE